MLSQYLVVSIFSNITFKPVFPSGNVFSHSQTSCLSEKFFYLWETFFPITNFFLTEICFSDLLSWETFLALNNFEKFFLPRVVTRFYKPISLIFSDFRIKDFMIFLDFSYIFLTFSWFYTQLKPSLNTCT